jgi:hypothetical protein
MATTPFMQVRMLVGDTDPNEQLMQDEEIVWELANENGSLFRAAWRVALDISAEFSRRADTAIGYRSLQLKGSQKAAAYKKLADMLHTRATNANTTVYAGGLTYSDKEIPEEDPDRVRPAFTRTMQLYPGTEESTFEGDQELED